MASDLWNLRCSLEGGFVFFQVQSHSICVAGDCQNQGIDVSHGNFVAVRVYCFGGSLPGCLMCLGSLLSQIPSVCDVDSALQKNVDYLLIAKPVRI